MNRLCREKQRLEEKLEFLYGEWMNEN